MIKLSPQYEVFHDGPEVEAEGPVPAHAQLKLNSTLMYGPTRFVMDGLLSEEQCGQLLSLADEAKIGDGYGGDESPHSDGERSGVGTGTGWDLASRDRDPGFIPSHCRSLLPNSCDANVDKCFNSKFSVNLALAKSICIWTKTKPSGLPNPFKDASGPVTLKYTLCW